MGKTEVVVIGGGVVGLSLAYELAGRGATVALLERDVPGKQASWAGAGILPPGSWYDPTPVLDELAQCSATIYPAWSDELRELTGIDNGWRICGGIYLESDETLPGECLKARMDRFSRRGHRVSSLDRTELVHVVPAIAAKESSAAHFITDEAQVRNPRHLQALERACEIRGVAIHRNCPVTSISSSVTTAGRKCISHVDTPCGTFKAAHYCITNGSWVSQLSADCSTPTDVKPIRGQMLLFRAKEKFFEPNIHADGMYLVARDDGYVLAGATVEDVGFRPQTTEAGVELLKAFATRVMPALKNAPLERAWAGLRPAANDQLPYLGRIGDLENGWIAAAHYRAGLQLAPASAHVLADLITGRPVDIDLNTLQFPRLATPHSARAS